MTSAIARQSWAEIVGIVDVSDEALSHGQELLGLRDGALFRDLEAALATAEADATIINTPSEWYYVQCEACIDAGLDVLVAKPITNDYEEAAQLLEHAERAGRSLSVGQKVKLNRHYQAVSGARWGRRSASRSSIRSHVTKASISPRWHNQHRTRCSVITSTP